MCVDQKILNEPVQTLRGEANILSYFSDFVPFHRFVIVREYFRKTENAIERRQEFMGESMFCRIPVR